MAKWASRSLMLSETSQMSGGWLGAPGCLLAAILALVSAMMLCKAACRWWLPLVSIANGSGRAQAQL